MEHGGRGYACASVMYFDSVMLWCKLYEIDFMCYLLRLSLVSAFGQKELESIPVLSMKNVQNNYQV